MTHGKGSRMNYKQKLEYLSEYRDEMIKIEGNLTEYEKWFTMGTKATQMLSFCGSIGSSDNSNKIERAAIEMAKIAQQLDNECKLAQARREEILDVIRHKAKNKRHAEILEMKFIKGMSYTRISMVINKDVRTVQRVIHKAIDSLDI